MMNTNHTSWYFGTARLNLDLLLDFANEVNFMMCRTMTWNLKPKRALEHFICNWYSRSECCHLSPLVKWKMRNKTAFFLNSAFLKSLGCPLPPKKNIKKPKQIVLHYRSILEVFKQKSSSLIGNVPLYMEIFYANDHLCGF